MSPTVLVLTGGIGSGKSTVARFMQACGGLLFDADAESRALTAPGGAALPAIVAAFGASALDGHGALDRARMRQRVFSQPAERQRLEAILHPLIAQARQALLAQAGERPVVLDIPLWVETGARTHGVHRAVVVDCHEATQIQRVQARSGLPVDDIQRIVAQQAQREDRRAVADAVIFNEGLGLEALDRQVQALWRHWGLPGP